MKEYKKAISAITTNWAEMLGRLQMFHHNIPSLPVNPCLDETANPLCTFTFEQNHRKNCGEWETLSVCHLGLTNIQV